jgi:hypothetical protein
VFCGQLRANFKTLTEGRHKPHALPIRFA